MEANFLLDRCPKKYIVQIHADRFTMIDPYKRPLVSSNALFNFLTCIFVLWIVFSIAMTTLWGKQILSLYFFILLSV